MHNTTAQRRITLESRLLLLTTFRPVCIFLAVYCSAHARVFLPDPFVIATRRRQRRWVYSPYAWVPAWRPAYCSCIFTSTYPPTQLCWSSMSIPARLALMHCRTHAAWCDQRYCQCPAALPHAPRTYHEARATPDVTCCHFARASSESAAVHDSMYGCRTATQEDVASMRGQSLPAHSSLYAKRQTPHFTTHTRTHALSKGICNA